MASQDRHIAAMRRAETLRFARRAAARLHHVMDPAF